jgi:predicted Zn-dependent protease
MRISSFSALFFSISTLLASAQLSAEQMKQLGSWDVHYIAIPATFLTPQIAVQYDIQRSKFNGVINISVLDSKSQQAQRVVLNGIAKDLFGRQRELEFNQVVKGDAVYYLATLPYQNEQLYHFSITIGQGEQQQQLTFSHTFFVD